MTQAAAITTTTPRGGKSRPSSAPANTNSNKQPSRNPRQQFVVLALDMSWKLAITVLVPVLIGVQLDKKLGTHYITFIGLGLAFIGVGVVLWRAMQVANQIPVPKLTEKQKREIQKRYEEDDEDD